MKRRRRSCVVLLYVSHVMWRVQMHRSRTIEPSTLSHSSSQPIPSHRITFHSPMSTDYHYYFHLLSRQPVCLFVGRILSLFGAGRGGGRGGGEGERLDQFQDLPIFYWKYILLSPREVKWNISWRPFRRLSNVSLKFRFCRMKWWIRQVRSVGSGDSMTIRPISSSGRVAVDAWPIDSLDRYSPIYFSFHSSKYLWIWNQLNFLFELFSWNRAAKGAASASRTSNCRCSCTFPTLSCSPASSTRRTWTSARRAKESTRRPSRRSNKRSLIHRNNNNKGNESNSKINITEKKIAKYRK